MSRLLRWLDYAISPLQWSWAVDSLCGIRDENQDNYLLLTPQKEAIYLLNERPLPVHIPNWNQNFFRVAVADGMGGHLHGREVAEELMQALLTLPVQTDPASLRAELYAIHEKLWNKFYQPKQANPGTTLVLADINKSTGRVLLANIGDSRAFIFRAGFWEYLTWDHSASEFDWREAAAKDPDYPELEMIKTNQIVQAMGFGSQGLIPDDRGYRPLVLSPRLRLDLVEDLPQHAQRHADVFSFYLNKGETLLLASDGLWSGNEFPFPDLDSFTSDLQGYVSRLARQALDQQSQDNITVLALSIG